MTISDLIRRVKIKMDELTPFGEGLSITDPSTGASIPVTSGLVLLRPELYEKPIETYIKESIYDGYYALVAIAPYHITPVKSLTGTVVLNADRSGTFTLPSDFYKLKDFKLVEWERPVTVTIDENDPHYKDQFNIYTRGNISKPICVRNSDNLTMSLFSISYPIITMTFQKGSYVPDLVLSVTAGGQIDPNGMITLDEDFLRPLIWMIASIVYDIYEATDLAKIALTHVAELL
jgi:hypothetical protein